MEFELKPHMPKTPGEVLRYSVDAIGLTVKDVHNDGDMISFTFSDGSILVLGTDGGCGCEDSEGAYIIEVEPSIVQRMPANQKLHLGLITKAQADFLKQQEDAVRAEEKRVKELKQLADLKAKYEAPA
jgi:hypothetical protein